MTNEELLGRISLGDEDALSVLCENNTGLVKSRAGKIAARFGCVCASSQNGLTAWTKETLSELESVGMTALIERVRSGGYDGSKGLFSTYVVPFLDGAMRRHLESNLGTLSLDRDSMALVRKAQALYHGAGKGIAEIAQELDVSPEDAARAVAYSTHFLSADHLEGTDSSKDNGDAFHFLHEWTSGTLAEEIVLRKLSMECMEEAFYQLPQREQDILGRSFGVFGYPNSDLRDIAIRCRMKEDGVEKAKARALRKLQALCQNSFAWKLRLAGRMVDQAETDKPVEEHLMWWEK